VLPPAHKVTITFKRCTRKAHEDLDASILCGSLLKQPLDCTLSFHFVVLFLQWSKQKMVKLYTQSICAMFILTYSFYGHGLASSSMSDLNTDLITLCTSGTTDAEARQCISEGHAKTTVADKRAFLSTLAKGLNHCPYKTCFISTPGYPVVAPGFTEKTVVGGLSGGIGNLNI
jgi:hypothetical protein